jgi:outer membrane protein OmpA-like peptidoglycan-associated protein
VKKIGKVLAKYPSVRIRLVGYTDDREFIADKPAPDDEPTDAAQAASELALERAAVMKAMLIGMGISDNRIQLEGKGPEDPVGDNDNKRGRQANRRVELKRQVPPDSR